MKRVIKFRAWDGNSMREAGSNMLIDSYSGTTFWQFAFDPPTPTCWDLMQYTGLNDRNDVEIYEGDIVKTWHPFSKFDYNANNQEELCTGIWICAWETPRFIFRPNDERCIGLLTRAPDGLSEIIGNIYEHPELVKGGDAC